MGVYRFTMQSEETRGASQPNVIRIGLASDADATIFAANLQALFSAKVVSVDSTLDENYALPYPVGTNLEFRMVIRDAGVGVQTERLYDIVSPVDVLGVGPALVAAGLMLVLPRQIGVGNAAASVQIATFNPQQYLG